MLFNSFEYLLFLPLVFGLYWLLQRAHLKVQNSLLLVASYVFYGWWDWRFLSLIAISSFVDYTLGLLIHKEKSKGQRKRFLFLSILVNIGLLGFFKYFNFFAGSLAVLLGKFGIQADYATLNIVLPVGISFYTFQTLSYTIDIYKGKLEPTKDIIAFFAFVSFFPQLVAGPIERAKNLLPQFLARRTFKYGQAADGMRQILWGFFKKIVIADSCAIYADEIFGYENYMHHESSVLIFGALMFAFQIYGDFSGYSDIAIGTAKLFGIRLMTNFRYPYFSRNIAEFWQRWHISLSTWFRDYVYIPLGGSYTGLGKHLRNIVITFTVSGLWHGANWTFVSWGFIHGLYYVPLILMRRRAKTSTKAYQQKEVSLRHLPSILFTFALVTVTWVFFRAENISDALHYIKYMTAGLKSPAFGELWELMGKGAIVYTMLITLMLMAEWANRRQDHTLAIDKLNTLLRWAVYLIISFMIIIFGQFGYKEFIYFQF